MPRETRTRGSSSRARLGRFRTEGTQFLLSGTIQTGRLSGHEREGGLFQLFHVARQAISVALGDDCIFRQHYLGQRGSLDKSGRWGRFLLSKFAGPLVRVDDGDGSFGPSLLGPSFAPRRGYPLTHLEGRELPPMSTGVQVWTKGTVPVVQVWTKGTVPIVQNDRSRLALKAFNTVFTCKSPV